ncbi:MAG: hypothetical protein KAU20_06215 [Nanoarchaeota archaeon]|nr:hypothetical protein [Nanoarchaeota archaeon]
MKQIIPIIIILGLVFLTGCQVNTETKYQCANGEIVDSLDLCSTQICPELDCSECPKQVEIETKEVIKYECYDGSVEEKLSDCDEPEPIIKYQCQDGTVKDNLKDCDIIEVNQKEETTGDIDYKFSDYNDYQNYVKEELEDLIGMDDIGNYGGQEARYGGSVYFLYYKKGGWDFYHYWAIEVDAESGELIKYKDITTSDGSRDRFDEIWWTPEK